MYKVTNSLYYIILYYIVLYYIILYYIILYYIILYFIILYYIILYYIILYYIILYYIIFHKYKTFSVLIYSYINTSGIGKTRNCMETRRPKGGVFSYNFEFSQLPRVLI